MLGSPYSGKPPSRLRGHVPAQKRAEDSPEEKGDRRLQRQGRAKDAD